MPGDRVLTAPDVTSVRADLRRTVRSGRRLVATGWICQVCRGYGGPAKDGASRADQWVSRVAARPADGRAARRGHAAGHVRAARLRPGEDARGGAAGAAALQGRDGQGDLRPAPAPR